MSEGANFCRYCGAPVTAPQEPVAAEQTLVAATEEPLETAQVTMAVTQKPTAATIQEPVTAKKGYVRRALVSLLLFLIFTGGLAVSGWFELNAWQKYKAPYQEAAFAALEEGLAKTEGSAEKIVELDTLLESNSQEIQKLEDTLALYHTRRESEILDTVTDLVDLDYDVLFMTQPFSSAYLQYIVDLLSAFCRDDLIDSWLYPYYTYSLEYGANAYIDQDLWIYRNNNGMAGAEEQAEKFNRILSDPSSFYSVYYTDILTDHLAQNDHLYVTGLDMLNTLFDIPGYVLDCAVFVKAYGGSPSPEEMDVPGWTAQDYSNFWEDADSYLGLEYAIWEYSGLSAADFDIDWNALVDEKAYYKAYEKFMDTIAPGLDRYDLAQYTPDDEYYGGVRYTLPGNEATLQEIAAAYIAENPSCLAELDINTNALPSSYDELIADAEEQIEELTETAAELEQQKKEAKRLQEGKVFLLQQQETLLNMQEQHAGNLTVTLCVFTLIFVFLFAMAITSLRRFIRAIR